MTAHMHRVRWSVIAGRRRQRPEVSGPLREPVAMLMTVQYHGAQAIRTPVTGGVECVTWVPCPDGDCGWPDGGGVPWS